MASSTQPVMLSTLGTSATPQQKVVQVLVARLKNKLPCYSGVSLDQLEADNATQQAIDALVDLAHDSLDLIALGLSELLERLAQVLSLAMAARWNQNMRSSSRASNFPESPLPSDTARKGRPPPSERSYTPPPWSEPPPLDDRSAKYLLSVLVLFLRQTAETDPLMLASGIADTSFRDFESTDFLTATPLLEAQNGGPAIPSDIPELPGPVLRNRPSANSVQSSKASIHSVIPIPANTLTYEKTHMTLAKSSLAVNRLIAKYAGRIIYHLSASNWKIVLSRLRSKIHFLASNAEENMDVVDLQLLVHCALDKHRLVQVLSELCSLLVNMKPSSHMAISVPLRRALWNWIEVFPNEYNDVIKSRTRLDGAPERVFDLLYTLVTTNTEHIFWPTLAVLNCLSVERMNSEAHLQLFTRFQPTTTRTSTRKDIKFCEDILKHANTGSRLDEIAVVCALDMCRAASRIHNDGEYTLRVIANDIAHEIKGSLWHTFQRKPFWETFEEVDIAIFSEALVAVFRFCSEEDALQIFSACLEPERSDAVKTIAVRACLILALEGKRISSQRSLQGLERYCAPRFRRMFKASATRRPEMDQHKNPKRASARPKAKRSQTHPLPDRENLLLGILSLWRADPAFHFEGLEVSENEDVGSSSVKIWSSDTDITVKISAAVTVKYIAELTYKAQPSEPHTGVMLSLLNRALSSTFLSIVTNLFQSRLDSEDQRLWMALSHQLLDLYLRDADIAREVQLNRNRLPALALAEIVFLVSLTSADMMISQMAGRGLRCLAIAERQPGAPLAPGLTPEARAHRQKVYDKLGDPNIVVVGRVGQQKRIRRLLRSMTHASAMHIAVWEECWARWAALNEVIKQSNEEQSDINGSIQDTFFQWQNLTLFLASLGGACLRADNGLVPLTSIIPESVLPDKIRAQQTPLNAVHAFVTELTAMLMYTHVQVREVARDALGLELSPRLFPQLIKHLDPLLVAIRDSPPQNQNEQLSLFLDQALAVLKLIVENTSLPQEDVANIDISTTMQTIAACLARFDGPLTLRIRTKFCTLCDAICERGEVLTLRKDSSVRHNILDIVMDWITPLNVGPIPLLFLNDVGAHFFQAYEDELVMLQQELNIASLRTAVKLLDKLQLRPLDHAAVDDHVHVVSRLFNRYATTLLRGLDLCKLPLSTSDGASDVSSLQQMNRANQRDAELRHLVIGGLTHLVSANTESGFKQCLPLAYDADLRKRAIFAHVFARVLAQGVKFEPEDRSAKLARQSRLCELLKGSDMMLAMAICETCPASEMDNIISVLLNLFDTRASLMTLIKLMIDREVMHAESEPALFRGNTTYTRFISQFARIHGYNYLRSLIIPLIKSMTSMPAGHSYELDPSRAADQDLEQNRKNVEFIASSFLEIVTSSIPTLPSMFREICSHIAKKVSEVWPEAKFAALGAFMFLRFISPAVVSPETVDVELPRENSLVIRRGLMVVTKVIQNLANNIFFGKEAYMVVLNKFLKDNIDNVTRYLSELNVRGCLQPPLDDTDPPCQRFSIATAEEEADEWLGTTSDDTDIIVLHRFLSKYTDQIGAELLSQANPSELDTSPSTKDAWNSLCALLVDLGKPLEAPVLSNAVAADHPEYLSLMSRYAHKNTTALQDIFVETNGHPNEPAVFVFFLSRVDVQSLDIELLMYHIFKILAQPVYEDRRVEIIIDCTSFTSVSEIPLQWIKMSAELIPQDIRVRLVATHILNPNANTVRYLRRLCNVCSGTPLGGEIRAYSSVQELSNSVTPHALEALLVPYALEREPEQTYKSISMRQIHQMRFPVELAVRSTHLRITSVKAQSVSYNISCRSTEILHLSDISDVYSVSTGHEPHEFIIRQTRQGVTLYFSSPQRDAIVKAIRVAKGQLRDAPPANTDRISRFSNVPATLLHVGLLCLDQNDDDLRGAAYELLSSVCSHLNYDKNPIAAPKAGFVPGDPSAFAVQLSERLAEFAPELTLDFLSEASSTMATTDKSSLAQRITCLQYMSPWVKNIIHFPNPTSPLYERSGARVRDCIRVLADLTVTDHEISPSMYKLIWAEIGKLDSTIINVVLEELVRSATDGGIGSRRCDTIARIISAFSSIGVRGRLYAKLRRALSKTTPRSSSVLQDNPNWNEISTLISLVLVVGSTVKQTSHSQLYVPEVVHLVTLVAAVGPLIVRKSVYGIVINLLQTLHSAKQDDPNGAEFSRLIDSFSQPDALHLFGLHRATPTSDYSIFDPPSDKLQIENQEGLTNLLIKAIEVASASNGMLNIWRARWLGLVTATAFQHSPAVQMRAFIALGCLATSDVDDDFLYQMLVALRSALSQANESDTISVVSMLRCIRKIVPALPEQSRYILPLFWVAVALLQGSYISFYIEATDLLRVTLETMDARGMFRGGSIANTLLDGRTALEEVACQLDQLLGISFDSNFSFSLASIIFKGERHTSLRESAEAVLRSLLNVTVRSCERGSDEDNMQETICPDALGYFLALLPLSTSHESYSRLLRDCNIDNSWAINGDTRSHHDGNEVPYVSLSLLGVSDNNTALLVTSFIGAILVSAQGDDAETEILYNLLSDIATVFPDLMSLTYEALQDRIKDTFANSSNPSIIRAVSNIFRMSLTDGRYPTLRPSASTLSAVDEGLPQGPGRHHLNALEELSMQGLVSAFTFLPPNRGHATKMIQWISDLINMTIQ
ncbi:Ras GTPase activating protein ira2 [Pleurotus ostreatus]|uniref:Ras GTPase activating protein ira2 n=1 Tax=Pleurotus ostreatus TaxID=5322 RepID=A0A8H6ZYN0_PLEOS|nr:Ras GTPase activating protein ira2 [Pleurotus ostreatus]KAF7432844.1 Ras GTPase activating protein ira2 [Pleurotus ostreatus]